MPDCGVHYLWFAFVCFLIRSHPPQAPATAVADQGLNAHRPHGRADNNDPTHSANAKGRTGARPGPRKETIEGRNVTQGVTGLGLLPTFAHGQTDANEGPRAVTPGDIDVGRELRWASVQTGTR